VNRATPAIVTQSAVRRLPRLALLLFCLAYVLPGFLGREPWKTADVTAFGVMWEMAQGHTPWWQPQVLGLAVEEAGPLPYWLGALFIQLLPFLEANVAVRVPFGLLLALTLVATWYAVYHLARQRSAQPVSFAFGGEAHPTDYARAMADAGLLALVACLGLAQLAHETTPDLARLSMVASLLYAAAALAHRPVRAPAASLAVWALALLGLVLSGAPWIALLLGAGLLLVAGVTRSATDDVSQPTGWARDPLVWAALLLAGVWGACALAGQVPMPALQTPLRDFNAGSWVRLLLWFTWPVWPLVLWTLWRWRRQWLQPHLALPLWAALLGVADSVQSDARDRALLLALPALAALAAFALPTLRRSVSALIDWFTLLFFSGAALVIWVIWFAMQTGVPAKPAANVAKLAPDFEPTFGLLAFVLAALATLAWIWLVAWRVGRHREALWKSLVLPAAGSTLCWLLLMTLWLPLLDHARSYGPMARRIATLAEPGSCVLADGLSQAHIAALQYHGGLRLERVSRDNTENCRTLVTTPGNRATLAQRVPHDAWTHKATVRRLTDTKETLLVFERTGL
jgi:4-amino-4-deoxy-L-arabinose transferase-like glycosyltransferase